MNKNANSADVTRLTKASWKVFSGTFISFLAGLVWGRNQVYRACCSAQAAQKLV